MKNNKAQPSSRTSFPRILLLISFLLTTITAVWAQNAKPIYAGYQDASYPEGTGGDDKPTGEKPESKLWWNDNFWWATMWSNSDSAYHIFKLDTSNQTWLDTGTPVDQRADSKSDALWDGRKLYIVSHVFSKKAKHAPENGAILFRYNYDTNARSYSIDPGFPVSDISGGTAEAMTIARDSKGTLWISYVEDRNVMINHSLAGDDSRWGTPFTLASIPGVDSTAYVAGDDISTITAFNNKIGVMWSNQNVGKFYFAVHEDDASNDSAWQVVSPYSLSTDDHINMASFSCDENGALYAVVKTLYNEPKFVLLKCDKDADCLQAESWKAYKVHGRESTRPSRSILLIDHSTRKLYVFYRLVIGKKSRAIYYKTSDLDSIYFPPGNGKPFIVVTGSKSGVNNPTSTKQCLNEKTGIVVLASDNHVMKYYHNFLPSGETIYMPAITVTPVSFDYGEVAINQKKTHEFVVKNSGDRDLKINKIEITGWSADEFTILNDDLGESIIVPANQTLKLKVKFHPATGEGKAASLKIYSNVIDQTPFKVTLLGDGRKE